MQKIVQKMGRKIFSAFGVSILAMIFCVIGTVFAATSWSTWTADMSVNDGDIMTAEKWNSMVTAVEETKTEADVALAAANNASGGALIDLGNGVKYAQCGSFGYSGQAISSFWIDQTNKKVYVKGYNIYGELGNNTLTNVSTKTENTYLSALFNVGTVVSISCLNANTYNGWGHNAVATVRASDGAIKTYIWGLLWNSSGSVYYTNLVNSTAGMVDVSGGIYGYLVPTLITPN